MDLRYAIGKVQGKKIGEDMNTPFRCLFIWMILHAISEQCKETNMVCCMFLLVLV